MYRIPTDLAPSDFEREPLEPDQVFGNFQQLGDELLFAMLVDDKGAMTAPRAAVQVTATLEGCVHGGDATRH